MKKYCTVCKKRTEAKRSKRPEMLETRLMRAESMAKALGMTLVKDRA